MFAVRKSLEGSALPSKSMSRQPRSLLPDGIYHVTSRGTGGTTIFPQDIDRIDFMRLLETVRKRHGWRCHAYCLMGTHFHLILEALRAGHVVRHASAERDVLEMVQPASQ